MKKNILILIFIGSLMGCTDLTEEQFSVVSSDKYYQDEIHIEQSLSTPYFQMQQATTNVPWFVQAMTTDQILTPTRGIHGYNGGEYLRYMTHTWTNLDRGTSATWQAAYKAIGFANSAISDFESLNYADFGLTDNDKARHIAELRTLRAWGYLILLDTYGGVPIATVAEGETQARNSAQEVFDFIESELNGTLEQLPVGIVGNGSSLYRMNKASNRALLIRLFLNSEAYTGQPKFQEAKTLCENLINKQYGNYELDDTWNGPFTWDNINSPELIFAFPNEKGQQDVFGWWFAGFHHYNGQLTFGSTVVGAGFNGWGLAPSMTAMGEPLAYNEGIGTPFAQYDEYDVRKKNYKYLGSGDYEGMFVFGPQFTFDGSEPILGTEEYAGLPLEYVDYVARVSEGDLSSMSLLNGEENTGIRLFKRYPVFPDIDSQYQGEADIPRIRLAEIYFSLAECNLRLGEKGVAASLINAVIKRNYTTVDWNNEELGLQVQASDLDDQGYRMLKEWGKEFIQEGRRRTDLIRWNKFTTETWFNHEPSESFRRLMPLPEFAINTNSKLEQNPGY